MIFNNKKIEELRERIAALETDKMDRSYREAVEQLMDSHKKDLNELAGIIQAILDHFKLEVGKVRVDDPSCLPPSPKQVEVWKVKSRESPPKEKRK